jgi:ABC-type multidrug transport system ATPase subunit
MNDEAQARVRPVLAVQGLTFGYPGRPVFEDWTHDFGAGLTWVRGPNGCGKSTLLKLLAGGLVAGAGALSVLGIDQRTRALDYRRKVFWCGPGEIAFDHLSPAEYFGFMRGLYPEFDLQALHRHIAGFALQACLNLPLMTLSTGTQRKVWLATALSAGCQVSLLDEPINALDAASLAHLRVALADCAKDVSRAWIVTSHEDMGVSQTALQMLELAVLV